MATRKTTVSAHTEPAPIEPTPTGPITLPEMPPAETFKGLIAYAVDTATNQSKQLPLDFLADGVAACIDATADAIEQTKATVAATEKATASATGADEAAEAARTEASNLAALKTAVVNATADAIEKTQAAETAATNADTATKGANAATADVVEKTQAAQTATNEANAAKDAAIEATENLTGDVSALVLTESNKPRIQELAGIDYSLLTEQIVQGAFWPHSVTGLPSQVYAQTFIGTTPQSSSNFNGTLLTLLPTTYVDRTELCAGSTIGEIPPGVFRESGGVAFNNNAYWRPSYKATISVRASGAAWGSETVLFNKRYIIGLKFTKL